ncbi:hypothetical protein ACLOJK_018573 [Asimina triloba]
MSDNPFVMLGAKGSSMVFSNITSKDLTALRRGYEILAEFESIVLGENDIAHNIRRIDFPLLKGCLRQGSTYPLEEDCQHFDGVWGVPRPPVSKHMEEDKGIVLVH